MTNFSKTIIWILVIIVLGAGLYWYANRTEMEPIPTPEPQTVIDPWEDFEYVRAVDWPPVVQVVPGPFSCLEAGVETERAGRTESRNVDGRPYCVTEVSEGAAGSVYTMYAYATETEDGEVQILTWSSRAPQCANFDEPQMSACEAEQAAFNPDRIVEQWLKNIQ